MLEELATIHDRTAGGLQEVADPGRNEPTACAALFRMDGGDFLRVLPEEVNTFDCDAQNVVAVADGPYLRRTKIGADRIARL